MKRDALEAQGLSKEQIDAVMAMNGEDVNALKATIAEKDQTIASLTTERDGLKTQVADRDKDIAQLRKDAGDNEKLSQQLTDLQTKYDTDTKALQDTLDKQAKDHAIDQLFSGVQFTSSYAKKAAIAEFREANHEFKNGQYVGGADILKQMQKDNPDAFKTETKGDEGGDDGKGSDDGKKPPKFTAPLKGADGGDKNPFNFSFQPVRNTGNKQ